MKTSLDAPSAARRRLVQVAAAATAIPQTILAAVLAPAEASTPALESGTRLELQPVGSVRVSGRVVDAAGGALAGRRVVLIDEQGRVARDDVSDADGRFLLAAAGVTGRLRLGVDGARDTRAGEATAITDAEGTLRCAVELRPGLG